ncbi:hypothetical protein OROGR_012127 [Orobanche gracilis]
MSLDGCKRGFLAGCRPFIGLDGCHLKTQYGGILLCAVARDQMTSTFLKHLQWLSLNVKRVGSDSWKFSWMTLAKISNGFSYQTNKRIYWLPFLDVIACKLCQPA